MSAAPTLYLNIRQITEVHHKDVLLKDVADIYCDNPALQNKCNSLKIKKIPKDHPKRYIESVMPVLEVAKDGFCMRHLFLRGGFCHYDL